MEWKGEERTLGAGLSLELPQQQRIVGALHHQMKKINEKEHF
jgi:hypothetical protein